MAKKKSASKKPDDSNRQKTVFALKGTDAWKAWLDGFAASKGMPVTILVDQALREMAKREGHELPPPRVP